MLPPKASTTGRDGQVERVMALAREYLRTTPASASNRARSSSPSRRKRPLTSPKRTRASNQKENVVPQDDTGVAYAVGRNALFKLNSSSYTSAAMADILGRMSGGGTPMNITGSSPKKSPKKGKKVKYEVKDTVEAQRKASKLWRKAVVRRVHDGLVDLVWDDTGDKERNVETSRVRKLVSSDVPFGQERASPKKVKGFTTPAPPSYTIREVVTIGENAGAPLFHKPACCP